MLNNAEPTIAPSPASNDPAIMANTTVQNSGNELPTASNVAPLTLGDILYLLPNPSVPLARISDAYQVVTVAISIVITSNII